MVEPRRRTHGVDQAVDGRLGARLRQLRLVTGPAAWKGGGDQGHGEGGEMVGRTGRDGTRRGEGLMMTRGRARQVKRSSHSASSGRS